MKAKRHINFLESGKRKTSKFALLKQKSVLSQILIFFGVAVMLTFFFEGAHLVSSGIDTKNYVLGSASEAFKHLQEAQALVGQGKFSDSEREFEYAKQNFLSAQDDFKSMGLVLNGLVGIYPKGKAAQNLIDAGVNITDAGIDLNRFAAFVSSIKISGQGFESPDGFYETLTGAKTYLDDAQAKLADANNLLASVDASQLPANYSGQLNDAKDKISFATDALNKANQSLSLVQEFVGQGPKTILILFENNNELRSTGGFIGTYGIFKLNDGKVISQKITSVYDLDGQITEKIAPPGPFHDLTDHWGLRDSNWFPDFADSAKKASMFYEKGAGETPDAVIAVTPDLFVDLLKITGPINFPKYNTVLSADNFRDVVQLNTSELYDKQANEPKQLLADFEPLLLQKLATMPKDKVSDLASAVIKNLSEKNLIFYDRDPAVEAKFQQFNWAGQIVQTDRDYLAVINSNLGGQKTDLSMQQKVQVNSEVQTDGSIIDTITYTRTHQTGLYDQARNKDFIRFMVPQGSILISAQGFTKEPYYHSDGSDYHESGAFTVDADLQSIDDFSSIDAQSGTVVSAYEGKTVFGNWINLDPGQSATVTLSYRLPFTLNNTRKHSFIFQKQPGVLPVDFSYSFAPHRVIIWHTPEGAQLQDRTMSYSAMADSDIFIGDVTNYGE